MGFGAGSEGGRGWGGDGRPLNVVCVCAFLEVSSVGVQTRAGAVRDCTLQTLASLARGSTYNVESSCVAQ